MMELQSRLPRSGRAVQFKGWDGELFLSRAEYTGGDFLFRYAVKVIDLEGAISDKERGKNKWLLTLSRVSVDTSEKLVSDALQQWCHEPETTPRLAKYAAVAEYSSGAVMFDAMGPNLDKLWKAARAELDLEGLMFGFRMDKPLNMMGATGWDFIAGRVMP